MWASKLQTTYNLDNIDMVKFIFKAYKNRLNIFYCSFFYTFLPIYENND